MPILFIIKLCGQVFLAVKLDVLKIVELVALEPAQLSYFHFVQHKTVTFVPSYCLELHSSNYGCNPGKNDIARAVENC